jgi:hypothetical protein
MMPMPVSWGIHPVGFIPGCHALDAASRPFEFKVSRVHRGDFRTCDHCRRTGNDAIKCIFTEETHRKFAAISVDKYIMSYIKMFKHYGADPAFVADMFAMWFETSHAHLADIMSVAVMRHTQIIGSHDSVEYMEGYVSTDDDDDVSVFKVVKWDSLSDDSAAE